MTYCPRCKRRKLRMKVAYYLDIPVSLSHNLSKKNIRRRDVKVDGAGWPTAMYYCGRCGWTLNLKGDA